MSDIQDLIAEARRAVEGHPPTESEVLAYRLADALEQAVKERDEARTELAEQRHFHGEEWAKEYAAARRAEAERDALADRIERALEPHVEGIAYADDSYGPENLPEDYEKHYCEEDGLDWPCPTVRILSEGESS